MTALNGWANFYVIVGATALLLLFIGIHNAWDTVTHLVFIEKKRQQEAERNR
jgi:hypothetical protein